MKILYILFFFLIINVGQELFAQKGPGIEFYYNADGTRRLRTYNSSATLLKQNNDTLTQESAPDTLITDKTHFGVKDVVLVKAYPNPVADEMIVENLSWRDSQTATVRIYDMTGKLVQSKSFSKARETFSLISLANGSYQVLYYVDGKQLTNWKIIKQ